jgi:YVTN family beta-propeller protein
VGWEGGVTMGESWDTCRATRLAPVVAVTVVLVGLAIQQTGVAFADASIPKLNSAVYDPAYIADGVSLAFTAPSKPVGSTVTSYDYEISIDGGTNVDVGPISTTEYAGEDGNSSPTSNPYTDPSGACPSNAPCWYRIRAEFDSGASHSPWSTWVEVSPLSAPTLNSAVYDPAYTSDGVSLAFTAPSNNPVGSTVTSYDYEISIDGGTNVDDGPISTTEYAGEDGNGSPTSNPYTDPSGACPSNAPCWYQIRADVGSYEGPWSTWVEVSPGPLAFVANSGSNTVTPIDLTTGTTETPISVGHDPTDIAVTPDGTTAFVTNYDSASVTPINISDETAETPIAVGHGPSGIAITPNGQMAYVANISSNTVTPIIIATDKAETAIPVSGAPYGIAISPDGSTAYVTSTVDGGSLVPITLSTNTVGTPIPVNGGDPNTIAITPNGQTIYDTNYDSDTVTPVSGGTAGPTITVGDNPWGIAIAPNGSTAYAAVQSTNEVVPIDTSNNTAETPIALANTPFGVAVSPDGSTVYVTSSDGTVTPIDTANNTAGTPITVGTDPEGIAITPDQAPQAYLSVTPAPVGSPTPFDASASIPSSSPIASYAWNFGDGDTATTTSPTTTHTYSSSGHYAATVTETDAAGTSTSQVFTGQTVSDNGGPTAVASQSFVIVACSANSACSGTVDNTSQDVTVSGTSSTTGLLSVSLGQQSVACGSAAAESEQVTTYSTANFTAPSLIATLTLDHDSSTNGFEMCFSSSTPFTDKQGHSVISGDLAKCTSVGDVAPCLISVAISGGNLIAEVSVPPGDPRMWVTPVVSGFTPTKGAVGAKVTITGGPFKGTTGVAFNGTLTQFKVEDSGTEISAVVPAGATSGHISIITPDGAVVSKKVFTVT